MCSLLFLKRDSQSGPEDQGVPSRQYPWSHLQCAHCCQKLGWSKILKRTYVHTSTYVMECISLIWLYQKSVYGNDS
ncbi:hypothetical protein I7I50_03249 [Histoplasma capsulatum G186AR]|uniref:Uncharacterized protein n=1 Tax=Ajellomyces capsulatus TaxID=5037 RepID=A0A8H7Z283_AJECA|nr:hypothetical protein I7I52_00082 [Histoplasma capsulatum]QSS72164.1 hypothetical protein I7I50_03249 [Histoplasma capsulatum G186AR]